MARDEISILDKEGGHEFGIVFAPGGAPFVMALVDGSIFLLIGAGSRQGDESEQDGQQQ